MLITKYSIKTKAKPETIWKLWENVNDWPNWDQGIESSQIDGQFKPGSKGWLKPKRGPKVKFVIVEALQFEMFCTRSFLPLTTLHFSHTIEQAGEYSVVTHLIEMKGFFSFLFSRIIGPGIKKDLPTAMENLIQKAERLEKT